MASVSKSIVTIVILLGVTSAATYFAVTRTKPDPEEERGYTAVLMCSNPECEKVFSQTIVAGQPAPYPCKYCGKKMAYPAVRCENCGRVFAYHVEEIFTDFGIEQTGTTECPDCGYEFFTRIKSMEEVKKAAAERD